MNARNNYWKLQLLAMPTKHLVSGWQFEVAPTFSY